MVLAPAGPLNVPRALAPVFRDVFLFFDLSCPIEFITSKGVYWVCTQLFPLLIFGVLGGFPK